VETQRTSTQTLATTISSRVARFALGGRGPNLQTAALGGLGTTGVSTGDGATMPMGAWGALSRAIIDDDSAATGSDTDAWTGMIGGDVTLDSGALVGAAISYEDTETWIDVADGSSDGSGWMLTPYAAMSYLDGALVVDALVGYGQFDTDVKRLVHTAAPVSGAYDRERYIAGANATYQALANDVLFAAKAGYLYAYENGDSYTDSSGFVYGDQDSRVGTLRLEGMASWMVGIVEPYASVAYLHDLQRTKVPGADNDRSAIEARAGATVYATDSLSGGLEYSEEFGRAQTENRSFTLNLRATF